MSISKVTGRVADQLRDGSGRIEVLSYYKGSDRITSKKDIRRDFPPDGFVFAPKLFEKNGDVTIDSLLQFSIHYPDFVKGDHVFMDVKSFKQIGFPVVPAKENIFISEYSINQPILRDLIDAEFSFFYIKAKNFLYGPFKNQNNQIIPLTSKEVNKYEQEMEYRVGGVAYLLEEPKKFIHKVDCMTTSQLCDWFKKKAKSLQSILYRSQ